MCLFLNNLSPSVYDVTGRGKQIDSSTLQNSDLHYLQFSLRFSMSIEKCSSKVAQNELIFKSEGDVDINDGFMHVM